MLKVLLVNGSAAYETLIRVVLGGAITHDIKEANLIMFTGGSDVSPALYHDATHPATGNNPQRDMQESRVFQEGWGLGTPMVGICRGGQFLNVMSGGRMYQHVSKHALHDGHEITDVQTGETLYVSSTHHQMIMPSPKALIVATSCLGGEREWYDGQIYKRDVSKEDIEVVYYQHTRCLCFQPHPEFTAPQYKRMKSYFGELVNKFLFNVDKNDSIHHKVEREYA